MNNIEEQFLLSKPFLCKDELDSVLEEDRVYTHTLDSSWLKIKVWLTNSHPGFVAIDVNSACSIGYIGLNYSTAHWLAKELKNITAVLIPSSESDLKIGYDRLTGIIEGNSCYGDDLKRIAQITHDSGVTIIRASLIGRRCHIIVSTKRLDGIPNCVELTSTGNLLWLSDALEEAIQDCEQGFYDDALENGSDL